MTDGVCAGHKIYYYLTPLPIPFDLFPDRNDARRHAKYVVVKYSAPQMLTRYSATLNATCDFIGDDRPVVHQRSHLRKLINNCNSNALCNNANSAVNIKCIANYGKWENFLPVLSPIIRFLFQFLISYCIHFELFFFLFLLRLILLPQISRQIN